MHDSSKSEPVPPGALCTVSVTYQDKPVCYFMWASIIFGVVAFLTLALYGCFVWFREQVCIILCPYGRLQSAMTDDDTLTIGYDAGRREPMGKKKEGEAGDGIDCCRCVQVCPTGIDIWNGLQLECIGSAACIDACDDIMVKIKRPKALVRYDTLEGLSGGKHRNIRPRTILYGVLLLVGLGVLTNFLGQLRFVHASVVVAWAASMGGWLGGYDALVYFEFVALFLTLMLSGRLLQISAVEGRRSRAAGAAALPRDVTDPRGTKLAVERLQPGMTFAVAPGGVVPVASVLESASAEISLEWINGESETLNCSAGRRVPSGAINIGRQTLDLRADEIWEGSLLHHLAGGSMAHGAGRRPLLEKVLKWYVAIVLILGIGGAASWSAMGAGWVKAVQVLVSVLVVSCPCSTGLALPLADDLARTLLQRVGVFLRRDDFWARLAGVKHLLFDKRGTLTTERPEFLNPEALAGLDGTARRRLQELVAGSLHPISRRLLESVGGFSDVVPSEVEEVPGLGMKFTDADDVTWSMGRPGFLASPGDSFGPPGDADTVFRRNGQAMAGFRFRDMLRPESRPAIDWLRTQGVAINILSGDRAEKVEEIAAQLGLPATAVHAGMSPEDKAEWVLQADAGALNTLFLGDGANDSLACKAAACSGTPLMDRSLLEEKADFYFTGRGLGFLPLLFRAGEVRKRAVRRIFAFAAAYNFGAVLVCLAGWMRLVVAAVAMPFGSFLTLALTVSCFRPWLAPGRVPQTRAANSPEWAAAAPGLP